MTFKQFKSGTINLNGSRKIQINLSSEHKCTQDSLLDVYAKREVHQKNLPDIMQMNFITLAAKYKVSKGKLIKRSANVVPRIFQTTPQTRMEINTVYIVNISF